MRVAVIFILLLSWLSPVIAGSVRIGVLSHRGDEATLKNWGPTADYLSRLIPEHQFVIYPLDFSKIERAVYNMEVDFLLVNPGIYVDMEVKHRISRIATLNNLSQEKSYNFFGGVIFTRNDQSAINNLDDLREHSFMAVDATSLGGFQMAWRELFQAGINPYDDLASLTFGGTHDAVVKAVMSGQVDAGTVRTGILAGMAESEGFALDAVKILHRQSKDIFPDLHSTSLYPEWPFSKLQHTSNVLAQRVAVALLQMSELEPAAQWGDYAGWTVPLEYQPVHELLRELKLSPYAGATEFTIEEAIDKYWYWVATVLSFLFALLLLSLWVYWLNIILKKSKSQLERQHALILDSVADGIYGVDLQGKSTFTNKAMEQLTGWRSWELVGARQHDMLHHTHADGSPYPASECPIYRTFKENQPRFIEDDIFWRKDGSSFAVEYSSTPMRDEHKQAVGAVVVFRDISQRKQVQESARQYQQELAHVARLSTMGEMASGLAHELNQPLTAIATSADACIRLLESGQDKEKVLDALERVSLQARRAGGIIKQLREFVRKGEPEHGLVDLNELVDEVLLLMRPEITKAGVKVVVNLDKQVPAVIAQRIQIDQVILNLIKNAIESMLDVPVARRILTISTEYAGKNGVITTVADMGSGLDERIKDKLFTPFLTTKTQGMGLGLSISQGIIAAHNGKLYLDSDAGYGAVFRFILPIKHEESSA